MKPRTIDADKRADIRLLTDCGFSDYVFFYSDFHELMDRLNVVLRDAAGNKGDIKSFTVSLP